MVFRAQSWRAVPSDRVQTAFWAAEYHRFGTFTETKGAFRAMQALLSPVSAELRLGPVRASTWESFWSPTCSAATSCASCWTCEYTWLQTKETECRSSTGALGLHVEAMQSEPPAAPLWCRQPRRECWHRITSTSSKPGYTSVVLEATPQRSHCKAVLGIKRGP